MWCVHRTACRTADRNSPLVIGVWAEVMEPSALRVGRCDNQCLFEGDPGPMFDRIIGQSSISAGGRNILDRHRSVRGSAPLGRAAVEMRYRSRWKSGQAISLDAMLDALAVADVVFLGETHTDETTHRVELAVYEGLLQRKQDRVVLAMEMFERDVQQALDDYLAGRIDEPQLVQESAVGQLPQPIGP